VKEYLELIEDKLDSVLRDVGDRPRILIEAMRYAVGSGGKRVRPLICLAAAEAVGGRREDAIYPACAVEFLHNYTLVHDDLPSMDNDRVRRGADTVWVKFGEANAILVGDALQALAFAAAAKAPVKAAEIVSTLAAKGVGVVQGQVEDVAATGGNEADEFIYLHKTADLFVAAAVMGGYAGGGTAGDIEALEEFAVALGLAFQYEDDLLDGDGLCSREETVRRAEDFTARALAALEKLPGNKEPLAKIARGLLGRKA
jgi:geranylgeranyl diphosphate synthase type II